MFSGQFLLDFMNGYASILSASLWPLVVLVIFFTLVYYVERTIRLFRDKKSRSALTWRHVDNLVQKIEEHRNSAINADASTKRQYLVRNELQNVRRALDQQDEKQIQRSLLSLSLLAQHSDRSLTSVKVPDDDECISKETQIIYPGGKE